jgi:acetyl esterase/lipase
MAKKKKGRLLNYKFFWPVTDANFETESYNLFAKDRFLTKNLMMWMWDNYTTDPKERKEVYASPCRQQVIN